MNPRGKSGDSLDGRFSRVAARQHGAVSRRQALDAGFTRSMVQSRISSGRWLRTAFIGVYRVAGHPVTWQHQAMAACLSGLPPTVASHTTAAALFALGSAPLRPVVTMPLSASVRQGGLVAHRSPLRAGERCTVQGVPATVPARTLLDCARILDDRTLMGVLDQALCRQLTTPAAVRRAAEAASPNGNRPGLPLLREVLKVWTDGIRPGSPAEMRLLRRIERWGLPMPEKQVEIRDGDILVARLDLAWPWWKAGLEYDGQEHHGPRQWEADDLRLARVATLGWRVERVEKVDLLDGAERLRQVLSHMLARTA